MRIDPGVWQEDERSAPVTHDRAIALIGCLNLQAGGELAEVVVAYETWGALNDARSNAIMICHALSGDSHAIGWWSRLVGPGKPIDTDQYFVICSNSLGGCQGSTGPSSTHPDGSPYGSRFPVVLVPDMVLAQSRLLDHLGINQLYAVCGGSMGGMQAVEWAIQFPHRVQKVWVTAAAAKHSAMQIGFNEAGRQAIKRDSKWKGGDYSPNDSPSQGLATARIVGHLTFLSEVALESKFGRRLQNKSTFTYDQGHEFQVESYLSYQADKFTLRFDANSFLVLTKAIDYYEAKMTTDVLAEFLITSFTSDWLYPPHQSQALCDMILEVGGKATHHQIDLPYGHDAFLLDAELQGDLVRKFLQK